MPENLEIKELFENDDSTSNIDAEIEDMREAVTLFEVWNDLNIQITKVRTFYQLAKKWEDESLLDKNLEEGTILLKRMKITESELVEILPKFKGPKAFSIFTTAQIRQMNSVLKEALEI